jgi:predicted DNA-binding transcriptional regulator AlpA
VRVLVNQKEAAAMLGMGVNTFKRHVRPHLRRVEADGMRFPVSEITKWVDNNSVSP